MSNQALNPALTATPRRTVRVLLTFGALLAFLALAIGGLFTATGQALDQLVLDVAVRGGTQVGWMSEVLRRSVSIPTILFAAVVVMAIAAIRGRFALALRAGIMILGANLMTQVFKSYLIHRPYMGIGFDLPNSFPSGHTTVLMSLALALVVVLPRRARTVTALVISLVVSVAIISIVMLGWHRPSDVAGGILVAFMWAMALAPQEEPSPPSDTLNTAGIVAPIVALIGLLVLFAINRERIQALTSMTASGANVDVVLGAEATLAVSYTVGMCVALVALAVLSINLVIYLQTGRARR